MTKLSNKPDLQKLVIDEFSGVNAQRLYIQKAEEGLWLSEQYAVKKYFTQEGAYLLDLGCGTGRTTIPLYRMGFSIIGVDLVPEMIKNATKIAQSKQLKIDYRVGDATNLQFGSNSFDYALFSNNGWTQIPGRGKRLTTLKEVFRVLKPRGIYIFTAHPRVFRPPFITFWTTQWFRFHILKPIGFTIMEEDFGDRFFDRETHDKQRTYISKQYIHIPAVSEVVREIEKAGFEILEINRSLQISNTDVRKFPSVFYVCRKP